MTDGLIGPEDAPRGASIDVSYDPRVNFALQQNAVPFVKRIVVRNLGDEDIRDVVLSITATPGVIVPAELRIDRLVAGGSHEVSPVDVRLRPEILAAQQEREAGTLMVRATSGENVVAEVPAAVVTTASRETSARVELNAGS